MSINLDAIAVSHTPYYYRLATAVLIPPEISGINGLVIYIVKFSDNGDLCNPAAEPIGIRGDGKGDRIYQFRDCFWYEYDIAIWHVRIWLERTDVIGECVRALFAFNRTLHTKDIDSVWRILYKASHCK